MMPLDKKKSTHNPSHLTVYQYQTCLGRNKENNFTHNSLRNTLK